MEVPLSAFMPIAGGGCIPFHRVWYIRSEDGEVLWDRRRRLDTVFSSGDTAAIRGQGRQKGFDHDEDLLRSEETTACIKQALATMARLAEEKAEALDRKRHAKLRKRHHRAGAGRASSSTKTL